MYTVSDNVKNTEEKISFREIVRTTFSYLTIVILVALVCIFGVANYNRIEEIMSGGGNSYTVVYSTRHVDYEPQDLFVNF